MDEKSAFHKEFGSNVQSSLKPYVWGIMSLSNVIFAKEFHFVKATNGSIDPFSEMMDNDKHEVYRKGNGNSKCACLQQQIARSTKKEHTQKVIEKEEKLLSSSKVNSEVNESEWRGWKKIEMNDFNGGKYL